jgi:hypothetical protein
VPTIRTNTTPEQDDRPRTVVIRSERFPEEVMALRANDIVDVDLARGGRARGRLRSLAADELTLSVEGTAILTRLAPKDVKAARLIYRADTNRPKTVVGDEPQNERETWLERFADREVFNGDATRLWRGRFRRNVTLTVARPFELAAASFAHASARHRFFVRGATASFERGDQLKLIGLSHGTEQVGASDVCMGNVYLLLRMREGNTRKLYLTEPLSPSNLERDGLVELLGTEPTTFVVSHPGAEEEVVKILRVDAKVSRAYLRRIERLPDRAAMRRMRARSSPELARAEADVLAIYQRFGLTEPQDTARPLLVRTRVPLIVGTLQLIPFERQFGLD